MDIRNNNEGNKNNIDSEMGPFEKFLFELKNTIFGVAFVILAEQEFSIYATFGMANILFLQILIFPFHKTINMVWSSPKIVEVIERIVNFINLATYIKDTNWTLYVCLFYAAIAQVCVSILLIFYVSFAFNRKKASFTGPLNALRYLSGSFISTLFLPLVYYFVSMLACVEDKRTGLLVHSFFTQIECWNGIHILHAIIAIFITIIFLGLCTVISLTFFEYRSITQDASCRVTSRPLFFLLVYKTVMVISMTFLTGEEFQVLLLSLILIGSTVVFAKFYLSPSFHNDFMGKTFSTLAAINLWTAIMLVFAKIMETTLFEGSIIAWLVGIPFVVLIMLTNRDPRINLLLINVNKFTSPQEIEEQARFLLKLIEWQTANKNSAIFLDGYLEIHKQSCNKEDCPLKQKNVKNNRFAKALISQDETINEKYALVIQLAYKMYSQGLKKFPTSTKLRIAYAIFLLEKMQSKQQALQELSQAEQNKPPFDEQFLIYRFKKMIEDEIAESQNEGQSGLDVVSEISFQNHLRQVQANIEKSALLHMEFWSQLSEDNPDLAKLNDLGSKINTSVRNVEDYWNKLLKMNGSNAKSMRLYGKYLIEIINDKEAGDGLLEKARNLSNTQANKRMIQMVGIGGEDSNNDATPIVWASGEQEKFGIITGINLTAASLFGYSKTELLNKKVNFLMPQVYAKHHDSFLENYINSGDGPLAGKNKERLVFGKNKSQYIFPVYLSLKAMQSILQGTQFIATFRSEKNFKNTAYVLTQPDGTIDAISSSSINLLKIDQKTVNQKKGNIQDLIPNIIKDRQTIFSYHNNTGRATATIKYTYPKDSEYILENEEPSVQLNCQLYDLVFLGAKENSGFQFKFERVLDKSISTVQMEKKAKISNFQFKFDKSRPLIYGEYVEGTSTTDFQSGPNEEEMLVGLQNTDNNYEPGLETAKKLQPEEQQVEIKKDYGRGIKTLRLVGGRPQEIDDDKGSNEDEEEGENSSNKENSNINSQNKQPVPQEEDQQEEESYRDFSTTFKSRKALTAVINDKTPPSSIKSLRYIANLLGLILFLIALLDYVITSNEYDNINTQIDLLDKSNIRFAEMMNVLSKIRDLYLINMKLVDDIYTNTTIIKDQLKTSLDTAKNLKEQLEQTTSSLSDKHLALLNQPLIQIVSVGSASTYKGLTQATEEVISRAFDLLTRDVADINNNNSDYYYVTYNLLNGFSKGLKDSSQYYAIELDNNIDGKSNTFLIFFVASIAALIVVILILAPILYQVNKTKEEVLSLFLDIPEKTVKGLYNKCETFVSNLQVGEDEDMVSEIDEEDFEKQEGGHDATDFIPRRRRKRFKNSGGNKRSFFIKILAVALALEGYFLYTYISALLLLGDISTLIPEMNATSFAEPFFSFANNAERQLFINSSFPILGMDAGQIASDNIKIMYDLDSQILESLISNKGTLNQSKNSLRRIMMSNPCPYLDSYVPVTTCSTFADQTAFQGMTVALSRHFENLRTLLNCYTKINSGQTCNVQPTTSKSVDTTNSTRNQVLNLMRTTQSIEIDTMQHTYIKQTLRILMRNFKSSLKDSLDNALTLKLIIFIVYTVVTLTVYLILWQTLILKISNDIWRTKSMLNMIPLSVIAKIKSIRLYLKKFWNERNLAEA